MKRLAMVLLFLSLATPLLAEPAPTTQLSKSDQLAKAALDGLERVPPMLPGMTREQHMEKVMQYYRDHAALSLELYQLDPDHKRIVQALSMRWNVLRWDNKFADIISETDAYLKAHPDGPAKDAAFSIRAQSRLALAQTTEERAAVIKETLAAGKDREFLAPLYSGMISAIKKSGHKEEAAAYWKDFLVDFKDTKYVKELGARKDLYKDKIGKPVDFKFNDAISGRLITTESLRGKVVVLDFWATWCGPCKAEMPKLKEIYAKFKDQGVEFIGVNVDNGDDGIEVLRKFVAANQIPWPQYYQEPDNFIQKWNVNQFPTIFVIDTQGNLVTAQGRGKLETLLPELLAKKPTQTLSAQ